VCNNSGSVAVPQKDVITVEGESIKLHCLFKGNLQVLNPVMSAYWAISSYGQHSEPTYITDNSTDPYNIAIYQTCLSEDGSCCNFTVQLSISHISLDLDGADLTCGVTLDGVHSHAAKLSKYVCVYKVVSNLYNVLQVHNNLC